MSKNLNACDFGSKDAGRYVHNLVGTKQWAKDNTWNLYTCAIE